MRKHLKLKQHEGFTLVELMVVVAIVAILTVIVIPSYQGVVERGNRSDIITHANTIAMRQEQYFSENLSYTSELTGEDSLNFGSDMSPSGKGHAEITVTPNNCDPTDPVNRCTGYVISVIRDFNNSNPSEAQLRCGTLTLNNLGVRGVEHSGGTVEECWR